VVRIYCNYSVYIYVNGKMIPVETISGMAEWGLKENDGWGELKNDIFDML
jgi:hypothetical protein